MRESSVPLPDIPPELAISDRLLSLRPQLRCRNAGAAPPFRRLTAIRFALLFVHWWRTSLVLFAAGTRESP